jgi:hypothetical protein
MFNQMNTLSGAGFSPEAVTDMVGNMGVDKMADPAYVEEISSFSTKIAGMDMSGLTNKDSMGSLVSSMDVSSMISGGTPVTDITGFFENDILGSGLPVDLNGMDDIQIQNMGVQVSGWVGNGASFTEVSSFCTKIQNVDNSDPTVLNTALGSFDFQAAGVFGPDDFDGFLEKTTSFTNAGFSGSDIFGNVSLGAVISNAGSSTEIDSFLGGLTGSGFSVSNITQSLGGIDINSLVSQGSSLGDIGGFMSGMSGQLGMSPSIVAGMSGKLGGMMDKFGGSTVRMLRSKLVSVSTMSLGSVIHGQDTFVANIKKAKEIFDNPTHTLWEDTLEKGTRDLQKKMNPGLPPIMGKAKETISGLEGQVSGIQGKVSSLQSKVTSGAISGIQKQVKSVVGQLRSAKQQITSKIPDLLKK